MEHSRECIIYILSPSYREDKNEIHDKLVEKQYKVKEWVSVTQVSAWINKPQNQIQLFVTDLSVKELEEIVPHLLNTVILYIGKEEYTGIKNKGKIIQFKDIHTLKEYLFHRKSGTPEKPKEKEHKEEAISVVQTEEKKKVEVDDVEKTSRPIEGPIKNTENHHIENYKLRKDIQRQLYSKKQRDSHIKIGVWSPIHRMGVTSFTINFGLYLASNRENVTVLEALNKQYAMKDWLLRYTKKPNNWVSLASSIQMKKDTDRAVDASNSNWTYKDVLFLPLNKGDIDYKWEQDSLEIYMTTIEYNDIALIDFPTGIMKTYTKNALQYLDQLWILVDDAIQETIAWKEYINNLKEEIDCPIYLIFNKHYSFSQAKKVSKELGVPLIATIPCLHEETMMNYYENEPLCFKDDIQEKLAKPFEELAKHLTNNQFQLFPKKNTLKSYILEIMKKPFKSVVEQIKS